MERQNALGESALLLSDSCFTFPALSDSLIICFLCRFINGLSQDVNLTIDSKQFISVQRNCGVSGYSLVERDT